MTLPMTPRQHWIGIAQGLQQDLAGYQALQSLLQQQFHAALRHDAAAMEAVAQQITAQAEQLEAASRQRVLHARALMRAQEDTVSMTQLFLQLKAPLQQQLQALWDRLQQQVQECKSLNLRNCRLIMEQAELMRNVITGGMPDEDIYAPR